jgi:putative two-component system response regulator
MNDSDLLASRFLLVDDEPANLALLERLLSKFGYENLQSTADPRQALDLFRSFSADIVLLDLHMPYLDGYQLLELLSSAIAPGAFVPRLVLTADVSTEAKRRALDLGATDFLTKPFDQMELMLRTRNALRTRLLSVAQQSYSETLEERVRERTSDLEIARLDVIERLARVSGFRDDITHRHTQRVGRESAVVAQRLGLAAAEVELIGRAAPLHDIGKIGIPDSVLMKPGALTEAEFEIMKRHTLIGAEILEGGRSPLMRMAEELARTHHERWDGGGYPHGLRGSAIPLVSRIVSPVDVFDALTHERPYKPAWPVDRAIAELRRLRGLQFDPAIVDALLPSIEKASAAPPYIAPAAAFPMGGPRSATAASQAS